MQPLTLRTDRLVLDQPRDGDVDAITEYCQDPLFERYLTVPWPYEREHAVSFVSDYIPAGWSNDSEATWALRTTEGDLLLGVVSIRFEHNDLGFWIGYPHRGRGYMPEAVAAVCDWAFERAGDARFIVWECAAGNVASARVARKSGFRFAGTAPLRIPARDGSYPLGWHGSLAPGIRSVHGGWPAIVTS